MKTRWSLLIALLTVFIVVSVSGCDKKKGAETAQTQAVSTEGSSGGVAVNEVKANPQSISIEYCGG
jgi:uncharacterized lipoprotein YehR (DUF1307 family)